MENPYAAPVVTGNEVAQYAAAQPGGVTLEMLEALRQTRPWVLFLSILGFVMCGFMVLAGIITMATSAIPGIPAQSMPLGLLGLVYWALVPFYLVPSLKLFKYAGAIRTAVSGGGVPAVEEALRQQKGFWKLVGIFTLLAMVLYVLILLGVVIFAAAGSMRF